MRVKKITDESSDLDYQGYLYMKFFKYVETQKRSSALITHPIYQDIYMPKSTSPQGLFANNVNPTQVRIENNYKDVIAALPSQIGKDFVLLHTEIGEEKEGKEHLRELDKAIGGIYEQLAQNGMLVVIFGGKTSRSENGLCMVRIKKPRKEELE